ncbi:2385_t:CDS:1, partial [Acaulospora morrowiae]
FNPSDTDNEEIFEFASNTATTNNSTSNKTSTVWEFMHKETSANGITII